jgi:hypothetical protein
MRLLEDSGLVNQRDDKAYDITSRGVQAVEFFQNQFVPISEEEDQSLFSSLTIISNLVDRFPIITIFIQFIISLLGLLWLSITYQTGLIGFFIVSFDQPMIAVIASFSLTLVGLLLFYGISLRIMKRSFSHLSFLGHIALPYAGFIGVVSLTSLLSEIVTIIPSTEILGFSLTVLFQFGSLAYYIHIFQKNRMKSLDRVVVAILAVQYWNLLLVYTFF